MTSYLSRSSTCFVDQLTDWPSDIFRRFWPIYSTYIKCKQYQLNTCIHFPTVPTVDRWGICLDSVVGTPFEYTVTMNVLGLPIERTWIVLLQNSLPQNTVSEANTRQQLLRLWMWTIKVKEENSYKRIFFLQKWRIIG